MGEADVADLSLVPKQLELADGFGQLNLRVDSVQLEELAPLQAEAAQGSARTRRHAAPTETSAVRRCGDTPRRLRRQLVAA